MNLKLAIAIGAGIGAVLMPLSAFAGCGIIAFVLAIPACVVVAIVLRRTSATALFRGIIATTGISITILLAIVVYMLFFYSVPY